ncbi:MAG: hypothetical protein V4463_23085 [Pseudomonadota bacterium]
MKTATLDHFLLLLEDIGRALLRAVRYGLRAVTTMSWPALMLACVVLAFAMTVIPLAILLFVIFTAVKLIVGALVLHNRRRAHDSKE